MEIFSENPVNSSVTMRYEFMMIKGFVKNKWSFFENMQSDILDHVKKVVRLAYMRRFWQFVRKKAIGQIFATFGIIVAQMLQKKLSRKSTIFLI